MKQYNPKTIYLMFTLHSTRRESEWKTIKLPSQEKSYEQLLINTISLPDFDLYQFSDLAGCAVATDTWPEP